MNKLLDMKEYLKRPRDITGKTDNVRIDPLEEDGREDPKKMSFASTKSERLGGEDMYTLSNDVYNMMFLLETNTVAFLWSIFVIGIQIMILRVIVFI